LNILTTIAEAKVKVKMKIHFAKVVLHFIRNFCSDYFRPKKNNMAVGLNLCLDISLMALTKTFIARRQIRKDHAVKNLKHGDRAKFLDYVWHHYDSENLF